MHDSAHTPSPSSSPSSSPPSSSSIPHPHPPLLSSHSSSSATHSSSSASHSTPTSPSALTPSSHPPLIGPSPSHSPTLSYTSDSLLTSSPPSHPSQTPPASSIHTLLSPPRTVIASTPTFPGTHIPILATGLTPLVIPSSPPPHSLPSTVAFGPRSLQSAGLAGNHLPELPLSLLPMLYSMRTHTCLSSHSSTSFTFLSPLSLATEEAETPGLPVHSTLLSPRRSRISAQPPTLRLLSPKPCLLGPRTPEPRPSPVPPSWPVPVTYPAPHVFSPALGSHLLQLKPLLHSSAYILLDLILLFLVLLHPDLFLSLFLPACVRLSPAWTLALPLVPQDGPLHIWFLSPPILSVLSTCALLSDSSPMGSFLTPCVICLWPHSSLQPSSQALPQFGLSLMERSFSNSLLTTCLTQSSLPYLPFSPPFRWGLAHQVAQRGLCTFFKPS